MDSEAQDAEPPSYEDHSKDAPVSPDEQTKNVSDEATSTQVQQEAVEKTEEGPETTYEVPVRLESTEDVLAPHPDDRPAPLFFKKKAETPAVEGETQSNVQAIAAQVSHS